ncbi:MULTISPECIES: DUF5685 family protein [Streptomyces]|uniref:DUF5685 family protein n=1 Tax=Streptomyces TaxID=1883 RepID=UPI000F76958F|nr:MULTISPECIES: DUF5685 family protein [Streptomyces]RST03942.1 hypothetical protein EF910_19470 [Streptomyces sp. WAC07149]GLX19399.1 hypothetical protein Slala01_30430 [Streptomyces lavendulae subsp. lavendulae]GLX31044.1 hypothetical protein Slala02_68640 [Streptomyces lavendulae subsp. lavendulae]
MFGIVRPCAHRLGERFKTEWMAHLCGLCLALRGDHGQFARIVTNYDGLLVSVLTEAQAGPLPGARRTAGPCPLRGMRTAPVANGEGARLAAAVSLVLASAKVRDHVADRDGLLARAPIAAAARKVARGWDRAGARTGASLGFDTAVLVDAVDRQGGIEALAGAGTSVLVVTEPTETATAAAFAHTAVLAGRPGNGPALAEAGRYFGRLAHLLDAVEDQGADALAGAWNPLTATGTSLAEARRLCDDALHGIRLALREVEFADAGLAHRLLVHELRTSVDRAFGASSCGHAARNSAGQGYGQPPQGYAAGGQAGYGQGGPYGGGQANPYAPSGPGMPPPMGPGGPGGGGGGGGFGGLPPQKPRRGLLAGCAVAIGLFCTCQICCTEHEGPWSREKRDPWCDACECCENCDSCSNCCDCCNCDGCCCDGCGCDC